MVRVGAEGADAAAMAPPPEAVAMPSTVDLKDAGLYIGLPALGAGLAAAVLGLGSLVTLLAVALGGGAGFTYMQSKQNSEAERLAALSADRLAEASAKSAAEAKEKERRAKLDVTAVAQQTDEIGTKTVAGMGLFSVGIVAGGSEVDYKLATFAAPPTAASVKQLNDLAKALSDAGYVKAQGQISDAASAAASKLLPA